MQLLVQMQRLIALAFGQLGNRNPRPAGNDTRNFIFADIFMYKGWAFAFCPGFLGLKLFLYLRQLAILQLRRFFKIIILLCLFDLAFDRFQLFPQLLYMILTFVFFFPLGILR